MQNVKLSLLNLICNLEPKNILSLKRLSLDYSEISNRSLFNKQVDDIMFHV